MKVRLIRRILAHSLASVLLTATALASPTGTTLSFENGEPLTGYFDYDPTTNSITSWSFTSNAFGSSAQIFNSADAAQGASSLVSSNSNNDQVFSFFELQSTPAPSAFELDLVIGCSGVANCAEHATLGSSWTLIGGNHSTCTSGQCVSSGDQEVPEGFLGEYLNSGYLTVSDPPGSTLAFNVSSSASTSTSAPEIDPASGASALTLLTGSLVLLLGRLRQPERGRLELQ